MLDRIADLTWKHPRKILGAALLFAAVAGFFGHDVEHHLKAAGFTDPSSQSEQAGDVLAGALGYTGQPGMVVLLKAEDGQSVDFADLATAAEVDRLAGELRRAAYVGNVTVLEAADKESVALSAQLSTNDLEEKGGLADESARRLVRSDLLDVSFGGYAPSFNEVNDQTRKDLGNAELIAFPLLAILLLLVFRSAVAAAVPLIIGALSIAGTLLALRIMASLVDTSLFALNIATALSLGLAVDYALLLVSRHREETAVHGYTVEAHRRTVRTAGRTAMFSGLTVAGAMAALVVMPQRFLYSVGAAGAMVGVLSALMAVLVAPALLAVLGPKVNALSIRRGPAQGQTSVADTSTRWLRLAQGVMKRPVVVAVGTTVVLLALAAALLGTHLTGPSAQAVPPGQQSYGANKYLEAHYGREVTEGVSLTVKGAVAPAELEDLRTRIAAVPGVDPTKVAPFQPAGSSGAVSFSIAGLDAPALSDESQDAVRGIRALANPAGGELLVAGNTAGFLDEKSSLVANAPIAIGLIVLLTVVLLFLLTGSVLLPLKTLLMNTMTLAASLGILVIVFEKKFLVGLLDYPGPYSVEVTSLVFLFAVAFALATDYAVLVMARVKELRDSGMSNTDAVAHGVAKTGRIISAAALMIAVVFAAFAVSPVFFMKQIAVGMALGVIIDATIVRALLVPSLMRLLGEANWWAPKPLRRLHDRFGLRD